MASNSDDNKLHIDFIENGGEHWFADIDEVIEFLSKENDFWNDLRSQKPSDGNLRTAVHNSLTRIGTVKNEMVQMREQSDALKKAGGKMLLLFGTATRNHIPLSSISEGQFLADASNFRDPLGQYAAMSFVTTESQGVQLKDHRHLEGILALVAVRQGLTPKVEKSILGSLETLRGEFQSTIAKSKSEFRGQIDSSNSELKEALERQGKETSEMRSEFDSFFQEANSSFTEAVKEFKATETLYKDGMALKAPSKYWKNKAGWHTFRTFLFFVLAACWGGFGGHFIYSRLMGLHKEAVDFSSNPDASLLPVIILAGSGLFLATLFFWAARLLVRMFLSELHLRMDATERHTMIQCYLALSNEGKFTESHLPIILEAIFRPTEDGIVKDDASSDPLIAAMMQKAIGRT